MIKHFENFSLLADGNEKPLVLAANYPPVLVPSEIFDENNKKKYLSLYFDLSELTEVFCGEIAEYTAVFSLEKQDLFLAGRETRDYDVTHFLLFLYEKLHQDEALPENTLAVVANAGTADFWLQVGGKLMLLNRFTFQTDEDFLYMVLNIMVQYNIGFDDCQVYITDRASNAGAVALLRQYVPKVASVL